MYITITQAPTAEQIKKFNMKISEEDTYINYKVDFLQFDDALLKAFIETFNVSAELVKERDSVTLTQYAEI